MNNIIKANILNGKKAQGQPLQASGLNFKKQCFSDEYSCN